LWFQSQAAGHDLSGLTYDQLAQALREAFIPQDVTQRYMSAFLNVRQGSRSVDEYSLAFRKASMLAGEMPEAMVVTLYT